MQNYTNRKSFIKQYKKDQKELQRLKFKRNAKIAKF